MTLRTRSVLTLLAIGATCFTPAHASRLPDSYLALSVKLDDSGSGIYLQHRRSVYFVTARQVLFEGAQLREPRVTLRSFTRNRSVSDPIVLELDLEYLDESHRILSSEADNLAALRIGDVTSREGLTVHWESVPGVVVQALPGPPQIILGAEEWRRFDEVKVGNDVVLTSTERLEQGRPLPLEGTLARKSRADRRLIVDVRVSPENLGGPVIEIEEVEWEPSFIGVVVEKIRRKPAFDDSEHVVVASVDAILELIEKP